MITRFREGGFEGMETTVYKNEPGTWMNVTRTLLSADAQAQFEVRYFEIAPGGYSTHERHRHEHCVMVLRGKGKVYLAGEWTSIGEGDYVHVATMTPHQFVNDSEEPLGFLCVVDKDRDRPEELGPLAKPQ